MSNNKKIVFVTSTRADYGKLKSIIKKIQKNKNFNTKIFVTGMHNIKLYGGTIGEIKKDKIKNLFIYSNQTIKSSMNTILANTIRGFSLFLKKEKPNLIIVHGDRVEPLACALSAILNNIKVAHIEGGEVSGTVDEIIRHAISKLSHIHFVSNATAQNRLLQMGERKKNIYIVGSPDVDIIKSESLPLIYNLKKRYNIPFKQYAIAILHPVTTDSDSKIIKNVNHFFDALVKSKINFIVTYPNNDRGTSIIFNKLFSLKNNPNFRIIPSLRFEYFLTLLKNSLFIIGNSSAGIIEAPYYGVSTINIGDRQKNRLKSKLIKNINFNSSKILKTIKLYKNRKIINRKFFGEGNSSAKIQRILMSKNFWKINQQKNFIDLKNK